MSLLVIFIFLLAWQWVEGKIIRHDVQNMLDLIRESHK